MLVTGASSGIGAATAALLAGGGARVAVTGRDAAALDRVAAGVDGAVVVAPGDLRDPGHPARVVTDAVDAVGGLDVVVANAGSGWAGPFDTMTGSDIDTVLGVNLVATAHLLRAAVPHLRRSRRGAVVVVGSIAGLLPVGGEAAYSAAKAGVTALAEGLRSELRHDGITVSVVSPGVVDTAFFDRRNRPYDRRRPRPVPATDVAAAVAGCIATGQASVVVPRWLGLPVRIRGTAPGLYRALAARFG